LMYITRGNKIYREAKENLMLPIMYDTHM